MHKKSEDKTMDRIVITPQMAADILEQNKRNRPIRDGKVKRIGGQMLTPGKWKYNGSTIKLSPSKDVLDGQHRLWACIETNTPFETAIVYDVDPDAFDTIDTIRSLRSAGDTLAVAGVTLYRNVAAEGLKWLIRWQKGVIPTWRNPENRVENSDVNEAYKAHPGILKAAERAMSIKAVAPPSTMTFVFYVLGNKDWELGERLFDTLRNPVKVRIDDPFFQLRRHFLNREGRKDPVQSIALCFKAINLAHAGKETSNLTWRTQGTKPEEFPILLAPPPRKNAKVPA